MKKYHVTNPRLEVGLKPNEVKADKFLNKVYVTNERANFIYILDSNSGTLKEVLINTIPHDAEVNDKIHHVYLSGKSPSGTVSIIDGRTDKFLQNMPLDQEPLDIEVNEKDHSVYAITEENFYKQHNNSQLLGTELKNKPRTMEVDENTNMIYVISDQDLSIINGTANIKIYGVIPLPL
jgi:DNA-binding beta-propeller fold protein YncE